MEGNVDWRGLFFKMADLYHIHAAGNDLEGRLEVDREEGLLELVLEG